MHLGSALRQCRRSLGRAALVAVAVSGCAADDAVQPIVDLPSADFAIVSNPVPPGPPGSVGGASAYVSLEPGTLAEAARIIVANQRTGQVVDAPIEDGGLDPVPVGAAEGDSLILTVKSYSGSHASFARAVPTRRPPRVVRVNPPRGRRDVAINASVVVVFSEPVDPATVTDKSLRLEADGGIVVEGDVTVSADGLSGVFVPDTDLAPDTEYRIAITDQVRDRDGSSIESPVESSFRTRAVPTAPEPIPPALQSNVIAFRNYLGGIMLIAADGSQSASIFGTTADDFDPAWSPDGTSIVLTRWANETQSLVMLAADGSGTSRQLGLGGDAVWSPDGARIAFTRYLDGQRQIFVMNADGSDPVQLTAAPGEHVSPAWSPDGQKIVFARTSEVNVLQGELLIMNADGTEVTPLGQEGSEPAWSPDGQSIAFAKMVFDPFRQDLYVVGPDGTGVRQLTANGDGVMSNGPTWSPDSRRIAFAHAPDEDTPYQIYVIDADGTGMMHIGPDRIGQGLISASYAPAWSPR